ncbi:MAG: hypothetical protein ABW000_05805 [Actinoplanes sp.]
MAGTWTARAGTDAVISDANRLRRSAAGWSQPYAATTPASANYAVEADVVVKTLVAGDAIGGVGRLDPATGAHYSARYQTSDNTWRILRTASGTDTSLAPAAATLSGGQAYRLRVFVFDDQRFPVAKPHPDAVFP